MPSASCENLKSTAGPCPKDRQKTFTRTQHRHRRKTDTQIQKQTETATEKKTETQRHRDSEQRDDQILRKGRKVGKIKNDSLL